MRASFQRRANSRANAFRSHPLLRSPALNARTCAGADDCKRMRRPCGSWGCGLDPPAWRAPHSFRALSTRSRTDMSISSGRPPRSLDRLVLAIGAHPGKTPLFSADDRLAMLRGDLRASCARGGMRLRCITFSDLVVAVAKREGASILIRGLRSVTRFRLRDRNGGHERCDGARHPDGVPASVARRPPDHRHTGASDCVDGRRRVVLRAIAGRQRA